MTPEACMHPKSLRPPGANLDTHGRSASEETQAEGSRGCGIHHGHEGARVVKEIACIAVRSLLDRANAVVAVLGALFRGARSAAMKSQHASVSLSSVMSLSVWKRVGRARPVVGQPWRSDSSVLARRDESRGCEGQTRRMSADAGGSDAKVVDALDRTPSVFLP